MLWYIKKEATNSASRGPGKAPQMRLLDCYLRIRRGWPGREDEKRRSLSEEERDMTVRKCRAHCKNDPQGWDGGYREERNKERYLYASALTFL